MQKQALFERWLQTALSSKAREIEPSSDMWEHIRIGISTKDERGIIAFWKNLANHLFLWQPVWKKVLVGAICGILLMSGLTLSFSPQARALAMEVLDTLGIIIKGDSFGNFSKAGAVVVSGPWGKEAGQFGGAGSFAVNKVGNIYILDQANERVQIFDAQGKFKSKFAIELEAPDYIAVDASGATYITDFWDAREVYVYSRDGKLIDKAPISQSITAIRDVITRGNEAFVID
ncbi:MAG: hypothetical protein IBX64_13700, partial [Actinobacteria bacterium]|nr:hypothetical protein [Actinomycetota bacterium]